MRARAIVGALALAACERSQPGAEATASLASSAAASPGGEATAPPAPSDATVVARARPARLRRAFGRLSAGAPAELPAAVGRLVQSLGMPAASLAASDRAALVVRADGVSVATSGDPGGEVTYSGSDAGPARAYLASAVAAPWDDATWFEARGDGTGLLSLVGDALGLARETKSWSATVRNGPGEAGQPTLRLTVRLTFHPGGPLAKWVEEARDSEAAPSLALLPAEVWAGGALTSHALTAPWFSGLESVGTALGGEAAASHEATGEGPLAVGLWWTGEGPTLLAMRANSHEHALRALRRTLESVKSPLFSLRADVTRVSRVKADVIRLRVEDRRADGKAPGAPRALALAATVSKGWLLAAAGHSPLDGVRALDQAERRLGEALAAEAASLCEGRPLLTAFFMPSKESVFAAATDARDSPTTPTQGLGCVAAQPVERSLTLVIDVPIAP